MLRGDFFVFERYGIQETVKELKSNDKRGLTAAEAGRRLSAYGRNEMKEPRKKTVVEVFLEQLNDPLIYVLIVAAAVSVFLGEISDAAIIGVVVLLNAAVGVLQEGKAKRALESLKKLTSPKAFVIREGRRMEIPAAELVRGDLVYLEAGCQVPADLRLVRTANLKVEESALTGEAVPVEKDSEFMPARGAETKENAGLEKDSLGEIPLGDRHNMAYMSTIVTYGRGEGIVTATGMETELGKIAAMITEAKEELTPLQKRLGELGKVLSMLSLLLCGVLFVIAVLQHRNIPEMLITAISLAVAAVPEGLPAVVTICLALSVTRMVKVNTIVRRLPSVETLGAVSVVCSDKTGTLTQNRMQVYETKFYGNPDSKVIEEGIAVNSTARLDLAGDTPSVLGNPTEGALLLWLYKRGVDYQAIKDRVTVIEELPFSTERKYMATVVQSADGSRVLYVKGAPEIVFGLCKDTSAVSKAGLAAQLLEYQNMAMRTLGFAYQELADGDLTISDGRVVAGRLTFLGIAAISDPVRTDVPEAMEEVLDAGIKVKIVTGDTPGTAKEIGRQIGLWHDESDTDKNIVTGFEIGNMSDEELRDRVADFKIIARARPMDKKRLVEALQKTGEVVAVTGDGTNDAPALKAAQVGLSMGDGTSVAKEASDITIIDNSFASIGRAVMWGRSLYRNIQRFILFQLTVNVVACLIVLSGAFLGMQSPLTVTQMLWVNLIMDTFAAMALASLPPTKSVMKEQPRSRSAFIINRPMWEFILGTGLVFSALLFAMLYYLGHTDINSFAEIGRAAFDPQLASLTPYEVSLFFTTFVFLQFWNMFNARAFATGRSALHFKGCGGFLFIAAVILVGQILIVSIGGPFFSVVPLALVDWVVIIGSTSIVLWIGEIYRLIASRLK